MSWRQWSRQFMLMCGCWQRIWATVVGVTWWWHSLWCMWKWLHQLQKTPAHQSSIDSNRSLWCIWNSKTTIQFRNSHNEWCFPRNSTLPSLSSTTFQDNDLHLARVSIIETHQVSEHNLLDWSKVMQVGYSYCLYLFKLIQLMAAQMHSNADFESVKMPVAVAKLK